MKLSNAESQDRLERSVKKEMCLVLSSLEFRHLTMERFAGAVIYNLRRKIRYRYVIPDNVPFRKEFQRLHQTVAADPDSPDHLFSHIAIHPELMGIVCPCALFDPSEVGGRGFVRCVVGQQYQWVPMERDKLQDVFRGFEFLWKAYGPEYPEDSVAVPESLRADYREAVNCLNFKLHRASIVLFARVMEGVLRMYCGNSGTPVAPQMGLGQLLGMLKTMGHPFRNESLTNFGFLLNAYRIESVHVKSDTKQPCEDDAELARRIVRIILEAYDNWSRHRPTPPTP